MINLDLESVNLKTLYTQQTLMNENKSKANLFADVKRLFVTHEKTGKILKIGGSILLGFATGLASAGRYFNNRVHADIQKRFKPYEASFIGLHRLHSEDYDKAAEIYLEIMHDKDFRNLPSEFTGFVYERLVLAVANSRDSCDYLHALGSITNHFALVASDGWDNFHMGWFCFRLGKPELAMHYFEESLKRYDESDKPKEGASAARGLMYVALTQRDCLAATRFAGEMANRDPGQFPLSDTIQELDNLPKEHWYRGLKIRYGDLSDIVGQVRSKLREEQPAKQPAL